MTIFYAVLVLNPPLGVWCAFAAYAHVVINPVLVGAALWADAHKNVPTITVDHSVVWGGLVCAMVLTSVGGVSSLHFCSKTMRDGGKTTDTFWKHETFRCYASAVFEATSARLLFIPASDSTPPRHQAAALWASRKASFLGWGDSLDSSRAALLTTYALRYLEPDAVKKWLRTNWATWERSNPRWFTEEWRTEMGARKDFPKGLYEDLLPPRALAQIKREKERREAGGAEPEAE